MIQTTTFHERLDQAFVPDSTGVVGLVDRLIDLSLEQSLYIEWDEQLHVHYAKDKHKSEPLRHGVLRAMLARIPVLLREQNDGDISPYGGQGDVVVSDSDSTIHIEFMNTPHEQWLKLDRLL